MAYLRPQLLRNQWGYEWRYDLHLHRRFDIPPPPPPHPPPTPPPAEPPPPGNPPPGIPPPGNGGGTPAVGPAPACTPAWNNELIQACNEFRSADFERQTKKPTLPAAPVAPFAAAAARRAAARVVVAAP
uniref:Uncharacterized protein n=1 Tax=Pristionchus pacificus TaxID=54126 RepID=A0A2A6B4L2_PRIPA|eukprot:PDM60820.1 hypothetical protein PRIPAC_54626 [Pristionchus pacificus]